MTVGVPQGAPTNSQNVQPYVRFGSLADICSAKRHVRFAPNSDIVMSIREVLYSRITFRLIFFA
jgi:hypothetical protein